MKRYSGTGWPPFKRDSRRPEELPCGHTTEAHPAGDVPACIQNSLDVEHPRPYTSSNGLIGWTPPDLTDIETADGGRFGFTGGPGQTPGIWAVGPAADRLRETFTLHGTMTGRLLAQDVVAVQFSDSCGGYELEKPHDD